MFSPQRKKSVRFPTQSTFTEPHSANIPLLDVSACRANWAYWAIISLNGFDDGEVEAKKTPAGIERSEGNATSSDGSEHSTSVLRTAKSMKKPTAADTSGGSRSMLITSYSTVLLSAGMHRGRRGAAARGSEAFCTCMLCLAAHASISLWFAYEDTQEAFTQQHGSVKNLQLSGKSGRNTDTEIGAVRRDFR
ncbi:hypothetical protein F2P81_006455 [Scophthalmus maximus]|uniref:Uncharacterized protein n=1 Tax=Scophthalmus maximus TaxID=52904 RepID=A0A6A4T358_SCOMX|nr:hypothetical protein F2P81_006455 [Scophthalmus maximus]